MTLQEILAPITLEDFFTNYYEKKHLVIRKNNRETFKDVLTVEDLDKMFYTVSNHHPNFRLVDHSLDEVPDPKSYTVKNSDLIDPLKFVKSFEAGCTLVMSNLEHKIEGCRRLTNEFESFFKHRTQSNIYLTPKNAQGFATHYDSHDVFILQFEGSKTWRIYNNAMPLADKSNAFVKEGFEPGPIEDEFTLHQGDVLYVPRGIVHDAYCTNENSGHITTGLLGKTWAEHLGEMLLERSKNHLALRRFTKLHELPNINYNQEKTEVIDALKEIINSLEKDEELIDDFYSRQKSISKGHLLQMLDVHALNGDSKILLKEKHKIRISQNEEVFSIKFYDLQLTMPLAAESFLSALFSFTTPQRVADIPSSIDKESSILMAQELSKLGLLEVS
ncbi:hypothetical protein ULMA_18690 [Patiriisocius marinus]|uniref:JmjC domain-containing protein n=1 Tax=Patiriisocius marinus TaxID=1397112 RepID=A0A5J4J1U6_9FLAO|nr:cupin domain-containing protein [Patiriisocius marinus]GER59761.1 hypothetical protein ULMA_18690 [Patiriisocius marinus]